MIAILSKTQTPVLSDERTVSFGVTRAGGSSGPVPSTSCVNIDIHLPKTRRDAL